MGLKYLHFQIFGMAMSEMASSTGSIKERLCKAHANYLYKIDWKRDLEFIPEDYRSDFLKQKNLICDNIKEKLDSKREILLKRHADINIELNAHQLDQMIKFQTIIQSLHWKKAKKAAELICHIYFGLYYAVVDQIKGRQ